MTVFTLSEVAEARLEVISFFTVGYLLLAWAVKGLWNILTKTFESLPKLTYRAALSLMLVSGLLMYVILTMISGARELMTPGAWERQGIGYQLRDAPAQTDQGRRQTSMEELKSALWTFAQEHDGTFPAGVFDPAFPRSRWIHPMGNAYFCYLPPTETSSPSRKILVYEPATAGPKRYVLLSDGSIELWKENRLNTALKNQ